MSRAARQRLRLHTRQLIHVLADAESLVNDTAVATEERAESALRLLREMLEWVGHEPSPTEAVRLLEGQSEGGTPQAPADYVAMPVVLAHNLQAPGGLMDTPQGPLACFNFQLIVPAGNLVPRTSILQADGQTQNPAEGMLPIIEGRWVIPRKRVTPHILEAFGGAEGKTNAAPAVGDAK